MPEESKEIQIKTRFNGEKGIYPDSEIYIEMASGMGRIIINGYMPKKMEEGLTKTYLESGTVEGYYLFINGKEITDGKNHSPHNGVG